jgi:hypothetical protein
MRKHYTFAEREEKARGVADLVQLVVVGRDAAETTQEAVADA